jgi:peptidoglycan-associated lipoprotein
MKNVLWIVLAAALFSVTACSKSNTKDGASSTATTAAPSSGSSTTGSGAGGGITVSSLEAEQQRIVQTQLVVYFDYDQAEIKPEFNAMLAAHGANLAKNAALTLRLEGNTDERGSREYNIGLGERRAQSVRRALMLQGASAGQLTTVSYGEERPASTGSTEEAWRLNRRVELVYTR